MAGYLKVSQGVEDARGAPGEAPPMGSRVPTGSFEGEPVNPKSDSLQATRRVALWVIYCVAGLILR